MATKGLDALMALLLFLLAFWHRSQFLPWTFAGADSIGPFWRSWRIIRLAQPFPTLHVPESGYALYYGLLPSFIAAGSLEQLMSHYFALSALVAPLAYVALRRIEGPSDSLTRGVALIMGLWLALSPDLCDTLINGARTYSAPLFSTIIAVGAWALLQGERKAIAFILPALPIAMMNHPLAACLLPGTLVLLLPKSFTLSKRLTLAAIFLSLLIAAPRAFQLLAGFLDSGSGHGDYLSSVATSNSLSSGLWGQMQRSVHDAFLVNQARLKAVNCLLLAAPFLLLLPALYKVLGRKSKPISPTTIYGLWVLSAILSFWVMVLSIRYVQHYHLRILLPPLFLSGALVAVNALNGALSRLLNETSRGHQVFASGFRLLFFCLIGLSYWPAAGAIVQGPPRFDSLSMVEQLSNPIFQHSNGRPRVIDSLHIGVNRQIYPAAIVLDQLLKGEEQSSFPTRPDSLEMANHYLIILSEHAVAEGIVQSLKQPKPSDSHNMLLTYLRNVETKHSPPLDILILTAPNAEAMRQIGPLLCRALPSINNIRFGSPYDYLAQLDPDFGAGWIGLWRNDCLKDF